MSSNLLHSKWLGTSAMRIGQTGFALLLLMRLLLLLTRSLRMPTYPASLTRPVSKLKLTEIADLATRLCSR